MKKIFLSIVAMAAVIGAAAQANPIEIYPNEPGDVIVTKSYNAQGKAGYTMKYVVADSRDGEYDTESYLEIAFTITDANNKVVDYGTIHANYDGLNFNLSMSNRPTSSNIVNYLSLDTKLMNDFLDYPDPFNDEYDPAYIGPFRFEPADYTFKIGKRNRDFVSVKIFNRDWTGDEKITTPAGEFHASKITFNLEVYNNDTKKTAKYKGAEWYAVNKGIVRTEIRDQSGNLVDYSEVTELNIQER